MTPMPHASFLWRAPLAAFAAVLGCSAVSSVDFAQCSENADCRGAFGLGFECGDAGLCQEIEANKRCSMVYPSDLLSNAAAYRDVVVLGSLFDHTPQDGDLKLVKSASLAVEQANKIGLAEDRQFAIVHCGYQEDDKLDKLTSEEAAVAGAKYLVDQLGAAAIVGPGTSGLAQAVYRELEKPEHGERTLIVSPSATSPSLTDIDTAKPGLFWRTAPPDTLLGAQLAVYLEESSVFDSIVLYKDDTYGQGLAIELKANFEDKMDLVGYTDPAEIPLKVVEIANGHPMPMSFAVVFIASEVGDVTSFLNAASASQSTKDFYTNANVQIFLGDAGFNDDVITNTQSTAAELYPNIRGVFPGAPSGDVYDVFLSTYAARYNEKADDSSYSAHTYDATWLTIYGAAWSYYQHDKQVTGPFMAEGLQKISAGDPFDITAPTWSSIRKAFTEKRSINVRGASGELDYDPVTEETTAPVLRWTIVGDGMGGYEFEGMQVP
jgi:branched-chain amino acid transport system substrate-binding protein